jgi:hypothetical protein
VRYAVWQLERGSEAGTSHLQGYVEFSKPFSMTAVKKVIGNQSVHIEGRRGARDQARAYCMKEETRVAGPWEFGEWIGGPGHRSDLQTVMEALKEGKTEKEILVDHPEAWARHFKVIERYNMLMAPERTRKTSFHVLIGDTGMDKTRTGYIKRSGQWYDGYDEVSDSVLDEVDKQQIPAGELLLIADRHSYKLPVKGGHVPCNAKAVYATSNLPIESWYPNLSPTELAALMRRVDVKTTFSWVEDGSVRSVTTRQEIFGVDLQVPLPVPVGVSQVMVVGEVLPTSGA